ncbi:MAG: glycosyltransferase family 2 protein [Bacteroidales bacterium]|nr:glycosyltransferase family 2 protein [Bacteroidales bacterium]
MKKLSLVITMYNEEDNVIPLVQQINDALAGYDYESVFVDDGSTDDTVKRLKTLNDPHVCILELKKNYGQSSALAAGIDYARGDYIITMDGDLQNDPSDIPHMVSIAEQGDWDLVVGIRKNRKDGFFIRKIPSRLANSIIRKTTGVKIRDNGCALKVFKSDMAKSLGLYGEMHRFISVLAALEGASITQTEVKHHARIHGRSKYGLSRTFKVISDLMLLLFFKRYMQKPMHFFGFWGMLVFLAGVGINTYLLILKIFGNDIWGRPLLILGILLVLAGFQMITIGIIVEYQMRTYYESQQKKPYRVKKVTVSGSAG